ncbi:unnamed protein product [Ectocarpus fasciculatus]
MALSCHLVAPRRRGGSDNVVSSLSSAPVGAMMTAAMRGVRQGQAVAETQPPSSPSSLLATPHVTKAPPSLQSLLQQFVVDVNGILARAASAEETAIIVIVVFVVALCLLIIAATAIIIIIAAAAAAELRLVVRSR